MELLIFVPNYRDHALLKVDSQKQMNDNHVQQILPCLAVLGD